MTEDLRAATARMRLFPSVVLILPLLLAYQFAILHVGSINGVDFLSGPLLRSLRGPVGYQMFLVALVCLFICVLLIVGGRVRAQLPPLSVIAESSIYALTIGTFIVFILEDVVGISLAIDVGGYGSFLTAAVTSLGAGVHEEIVFRLLVFGALLLLAKLMRVGVRYRIVLAVLGSSVAFAYAHHIGSGSEQFTMGAFCYRFLAGIIFSLICYYRSLAHAVYTHVFYDFYVLWVLA